jgi:precorrin-3B synthase
MRPLARELADRLGAEPAALELPAKFAIVLDGGGRLTLMPERADIRLMACRVGGRKMVAIGRSGTAWLGVEEPDHTASTVIAIIAGHQPKLQPVETLTLPREDSVTPQPGALDLGGGRIAVGIGVPFGRIEAQQLRALAALAPEIRLSPWRMLYIPAEGEAAVTHMTAQAAALGFVIAPGDPAMRIQACPGRPACRVAHADTRADAALIARWMAATGLPGTVHVSGCAKGCACSTRADITLVGEPGGYRLLRDRAARDPGGTFLPAGAIPGGLHG